MTDTDGPTLRDALSAEKMAGKQADFNPLLLALKQSGALDNIASMSKQMNAAIAMAARPKINLRTNIAIPTVHSTIAKAAAAAMLPGPRPQVLEAYRLLVANTSFKSQQQQVIVSLLRQNSVAGLTNVSAALRAGAIASMAAPAIARAAAVAPVVIVKDTEEAKAYGSHQLNFEQTLGLASLIWTIVQAQLQDGSNKHLLETHLLTLCLMTLIWCALAAAP